MRGKDHEHHHAAHMKKRAKGGNVEKSGIKKAGGNPYVEREAEEDKDGETSERKRGGHVKKHHRKAGGHIEGKKVKHRMDRAAGGRTERKRGGRADGIEPDRGHRGVPAHHARGGHVEHEHHEGHKRHRASGGRTGSDKSPLSSANKVSGPEPQPKTQEGGLSR
jgi:hypothetical protein